MRKDQRTIWILPIAVLLLSATGVLWTLRERNRVVDEIGHIIEAHVSSVARLVGEGAREAAASIDLIYAFAEIDLELAAYQAASGDDQVIVYVRLDVSGNDTENEKWGPIAQEHRKQLIETLLATDEGLIVEDGVLAKLGLYCARHHVASEDVLVCKDAQLFSEWRRETGIALLLEAVTDGDVAYVAIQDATGILVRSRGTVDLSSWSEDPELERALRGGRHTPVLRRTGVIFEGLNVMPLPDGSNALLRVGVSALPFERVLVELDERHRVFWLVMGIFFVLSFGAAFVYRRFQTRRQRLEEEIDRRAREEAHWKMVGTMAAGVAHEVRNPLNTVKMAAQRLSEELEPTQQPDAETQAMVGLLLRESDRIDRVVGDFLELGRPLNLAPENMGAKTLLDEARAQFQLRLDEEGKEIENLASETVTVHADHPRLVQALTNLLKNALDAIDPGGRVQTDAAYRGKLVDIVISDDGTGMDARELERVEEPFVTSKKGGTGLGLPIARRIIEAHGGMLQIESTLGVGTRVVVSLPVKSLSRKELCDNDEEEL